jgi:hypothetical protein
MGNDDKPLPRPFLQLLSKPEFVGPLPPKRDLTYFACGGQGCPKGGEHQWDGPTLRTYHSGGSVASEAATCSKCGLDAISHSLLQ